MKPLIVLLSTFIVAIFLLKFTFGKHNIPFSARIAISVMLLFTALGHFFYTDGMAMMIPDIIPLKRELVYFTAIIEILAAVSLHISQFRHIAAYLLIIFFVLMLPANIKASIEQINYQTSAYDGKGLSYLLFRIPLQLLFIIWVYISSIKYN
ncbi:hypothetical protein A9Q86_09555 [Flavobacteriales bacterium 33_180_T64]|nr:hypothetical protein A9Q86_09555 [Flavobacteriales bacterium 33_180_T64]